MQSAFITDLNWQDTVKICTQVASAIIKVHQNLLVIVDLKPENILLDQVLDFTHEKISNSAGY